MKTTTISECRKDVSEWLRGKDAALVTRHGRPAGVLYPLTDPRKLPMKVRRKLYLELSEGIAKQLETKGITEEQLQHDFEDFKKRRRREENVTVGGRRSCGAAGLRTGAATPRRHD